MSLGIVISAGAAWLAIRYRWRLPAGALTGLGTCLLPPGLPVLTVSLSASAQRGANSAALQLSEAIAVAGMLALAGALFAAPLASATVTVYLSVFGLACCWLLAVASLLMARRV